MTRRPMYSWLLPAVLVSVAGCQTVADHHVSVDHPAVSSELALPSTTPEIQSESNDPNQSQLIEAKWHSELGNSEIARQSYVSVLKRNAQSIDAIIGLARIDQTAGRLIEAEQGLKTALAIRPDDVDVISAAAQFYLDQERWADARDLLEQGIERHPHETNLAFMLAVVFARSGETPLAMTYFTNVVGKAEAHYNLAIIMYEQGNRPDAESHLLQALLLKPDFDDAKIWLAEITNERTSQNLALSDASRAVSDRLVRTKAVPPPQQPTPTPAASTAVGSEVETVIEQTSGRADLPVLKSSRQVGISLTDARLEIERNRLKGASDISFADAVAEPMSNAGGALRNSQPNQLPTGVRTPAQREQGENQLRARRDIR
ncbi:MAG: tetratricopeptide repeat protein [Planctomycetota bacterium]|nr:tetratricopeptide repeat protein [Planctomycetota bacterium]